MKQKQAAISLVLVLSVFGVAVAYAQQAAKSAPPVKSGRLTVNGVAIPQARIDFMIKSAQAQQGQNHGQGAPLPDSPELQAAARENLISLEILSQAAIKAGVDKDKEVQAQIDLRRQQALANGYIANYVKKNPIKDEALKAEYEKLKAQLGDKEYKARHILVAKEEEAKEIIEQLKKGGDFEKLAKEKSIDTGSKENGGDLDWNSPSRYVKPFAEALVALTKGQYTQQPVKSDFGFHVIRLDDTRELKAPAFDEMKENFRQRAQQQQVEKMVSDLRAKAKIEER